jgi:Lar family restriction alleviation protein
MQPFAFSSGQIITPYSHPSRRLIVPDNTSNEAPGTKLTSGYAVPLSDDAKVALKPCPFCRGKAFTQSPAYGRHYWYALCDECGAEGPPALKAAHLDEGEAEAIAAWNERPDDYQPGREDAAEWFKWAKQVIRDHADHHGPSGGAWNISMLLAAFRQAAIERGEPWGDVG